MCIFVASREHPDYALIVISNRDEVFGRKTARPHIWDGTQVYGPQDLEKEERGTWIGISNSGRLAILVNYQELDPDHYKDSPLSRGALTKNYLTSDMKAVDWIKMTEETFGDHMKQVGGFTMMCGELELGPDGKLTPLKVLSNRQEDEQVLDDSGPQTISLSNGKMDDEEWPKTAAAVAGFEKLLPLQGLDLVEGLFDLLSTPNIDPKTAGIMDLRKTIFVPKMELNGLVYGTRTQTIILVGYDGAVQYIDKDILDGTVVSRDFNIWHQSEDQV